MLFTKHSCYVDGILSVRNLTIPGLAIFRSPFSWAMASIAISNDQMENKQAVIIHTYTYIWVWVNTYRYIFSGMNIHLPAILGFTRYQGFDTLPYIYIHKYPGVDRIQNTACSKVFLIFVSFFCEMSILYIYSRINSGFWEVAQPPTTCHLAWEVQLGLLMDITMLISYITWDIK